MCPPAGTVRAHPSLSPPSRQPFHSDPQCCGQGQAHRERGVFGPPLDLAQQRLRDPGLPGQLALADSLCLPQLLDVVSNTHCIYLLPFDPIVRLSTTISQLCDNQVITRV
nr:MAG TPA: hypothetical protein [Caudoviricetes sp.]